MAQCDHSRVVCLCPKRTQSIHTWCTMEQKGYLWSLMPPPGIMLSRNFLLVCLLWQQLFKEYKERSMYVRIQMATIVYSFCRCLYECRLIVCETEIIIWDFVAQTLTNMLSSEHKSITMLSTRVQKYSINGIEEGKGLSMIFDLWSPWPCSKEDDRLRYNREEIT